MNSKTLKSIADSVVNKSKQAKDSSYILPIVLILVLIGTAVGAWLLSKNRKELARLRHEEFKRERKKHQLIFAERIERRKKEKSLALLRIEMADSEMRQITEQIKELEAEYAENQKSIDRIHSWRDITSGKSE